MPTVGRGAVVRADDESSPRCCQALEDSFQERDEQACSDEGDRAAEHKAGEHVERIVGPDVHAGERHCDRGDHRDQAESSLDEEQADGDGADGRGVITGKREVSGSIDEHMDTGQRLVWPGAVHGVADELPDSQCDERSGTRPQRTGNRSEIVAAARDMNTASNRPANATMP